MRAIERGEESGMEKPGFRLLPEEMLWLYLVQFIMHD